MEGPEGTDIPRRQNFVDKLRSSVQDGVKEIPRLQRYAGRPDLEEILAGGCRAGRSEKDRAMAVAVRYGYTMKEIAGYLNVHYATVSRALNKV